MSTFSIADVVTKRVIEALEAATLSGSKLPWVKSWKSSGVGTPFNPATNTEYRGINFLMLSLFNGADSQFLTFNQAKTLGGNVKKGSVSNQVVFYKAVGKVEAKAGKEEKNGYQLLKHYNVFNINDIEGLTLEKAEPRAIVVNDFAENIIINSGIKVNFSGSQPCYRPSTKEITVPVRENFVGDDSYYATLFHELVHASHIAVDRSVSESKEGYAFEELVAELGASMLCAHAGIDSFETDHTAAYLQSWLKSLNNDSTYIIKAAQLAQKAVDHLLAKPAFEKSEEAELEMTA